LDVDGMGAVVERRRGKFVTNQLAKLRFGAKTEPGRIIEHGQTLTPVSPHQQHAKALEDAIYLGWGHGALEAYKEMGERIVLLRQQLNAAMIEEDKVLPDTHPLTDRN
jgi:hypothetical protein